MTGLIARLLLGRIFRLLCSLAQATSQDRITNSEYYQMRIMATSLIRPRTLFSFNGK